VGAADAERARKVRVALNLAVDKQAIMQRVLGGLGTALGSWLMYPRPLGSDALKKPLPYDPAKAKALLAEAGYRRIRRHDEPDAVAGAWIPAGRR